MRRKGKRSHACAKNSPTQMVATGVLLIFPPVRVGALHAGYALPSFCKIFRTTLGAGYRADWDATKLECRPLYQCSSSTRWTRPIRHDSSVLILDEPEFQPVTENRRVADGKSKIARRDSAAICAIAKTKVVARNLSAA